MQLSSKCCSAVKKLCEIWEVLKISTNVNKKKTEKQSENKNVGKEQPNEICWG